LRHNLCHDVFVCFGAPFAPPGDWRREQFDQVNIAYNMEPFRLSSKGPFELCLRVGPADLGDVLVLNLTHVHLFDDDDDDDHDHDDDDDDDDGK